MARPKTEIDLVELGKLCAMQCTDEEVAAFFDVSTKTIQRRRQSPRFREIMERGRAKGRVSVRRNLFRLAAAGNIAAVIFLSKNLLGYKDVIANEHSGPNGAPIEVDHQLDLSQLSDEELQQLRAFAEKTKSNRDN